MCLSPSLFVDTKINLVFYIGHGTPSIMSSFDFRGTLCMRKKVCKSMGKSAFCDYGGHHIGVHCLVWVSTDKFTQT